MDLLSSLIQGLLTGTIYSLVGMGLAITFGVQGLIDIVNPAVVILAAYLAFQLAQWFGVDPLLAVLVTMPALFVLGALIQRLSIRPIIRRPEMVGALMLFGLALVVENGMVAIWGVDYRSLASPYRDVAFHLGAISVPLTRLISLGAVLALAGILFLFFTRTYLGRAIRATYMDRDSAELLGINTLRIDWVTYALGTAVAAVAGAIVGLSFVFYPAAVLPWIVLAFAVVIIGGRGSIRGTLVAGLLIGILESLTTTLFAASWMPVATYGALILTLVLRPAGLFRQT